MTQASEIPPTAPPVPRLARRVYYGYVMLPIATLAIICTSPGQTFVVSTFNEHFRQALGLSHSQLTGAYMVGTFLASLPMTWIGALMDRFGLRRTMTAVIMLFGAVCMATSQVRGLTTLFLAFLLLRMLGQGALGLLSGNTLPFWFRRRLGTVEGMRHFGMAGAIAAVPTLTLLLIDGFGWRAAWVMLGLGVWAIMLPLMLLFRNRPEEVGQRMDGGLDAEASARDAASDRANAFTFAEARRTRAFWIVMTISGFWAMANTAVVFNIVPLFQSRGLSAGDVAWLFTGFAVSLAGMQLLGGVLADRFALHRLLALAALCMAAVMGMYWLIDSRAMVLPTAILMGCAQGLLTTSIGPLWARYYGTLHIGRIRGAMATVMVSASSTGPFLLGLCMDYLGSYDAALCGFTLTAVPLGLLALAAQPPAAATGTHATRPPGG